jgi:hypothetical protein
MKKLILSIAIFMSLLTACEKDNINIDPDNLIIGTWVNAGYQNDIQILLRSPELSDENPGIIFSADGTLTERKNSGWCGTPPISYSNYPGTWNVVNDTLIQVSSEHWGGTMTYNLNIKSVTESELKVVYLYQE